MRRLIFTIFAVLLSHGAWGSTCLDTAGKVVEASASENLGLGLNDLQVRYIGGETFDGDTGQADEYIEPSAEYFDVFLKSESPESAEAKLMYVLELETVTNANSGSALRCDIGIVGLVPNEYWKGIYETYLD